MTSTAAADGVRNPPFTLAGQPLSAWAYALRIWLATMVALYAAFWLQLDSASSAAVTVAILAQPKRGQAFQKAVFRIAATLIGFVASIAITGLFSQSRDLFVVAVALWIAGAVYVASCYDGTRAYGAVLSGYTVAIIAVTQIDTPQDVFTAGIARVAVVALGIVSIALINDAFAAPDLWPDVRGRMEAAASEVEGAIAAMVHGHPFRPDRLRALLAQLTALRLDVLALPSERPDGFRQSAAGCSALAAMVAALSVSRVVHLMRHVLPAAEVDAAADRIDEGPAALAEALQRAVAGARPREIALARFSAEVADQRDLARREFAAMLAGAPAERAIRLPIHREKKDSFRKALRIFIGIIAAAPIFILSSWPMTSQAFTQLAVLAALGATQPNAKSFASGALIAMPVIIALSGITEFLILDGVDSFPLLALGMAPVIFLACMLFLNPKTGGIGFLMLVYFPIVLTPANPQSYNPQTYVLTGALIIAAVVALAVALNAFVPTTDKERRRWMVERLRDDLLDAAADRARRRPAEAVWLATDRLVQISGFSIGSETAREVRLRYMLLMCHLILATGHAQVALDEIGSGDTGADARRALAGLKPAPIAAAAGRMADGIAAADEAVRPAMIQALASMTFLADALAARATDLRHLRQALRP